MRVLSAALGSAVTIGFLAACSGSNSSPSSSLPNAVGLHMTPANVIPEQFMPKNILPIRGRIAPPQAERGIYVSQFNTGTVYGFTKNNSGNAPPICSVSPELSEYNIATDNFGNLIVPNGNSGVDVYAGPGMCGAHIGHVDDSFGFASDAASISATTGIIAVGNLTDSGGPGSISLCTLSAGCTVDLNNNFGMEDVGGVALAPNGDCWADALNVSGRAKLVYFAGCTGTGVTATGFVNNYYGGIDLDNKRNLVTVSLLGPSSGPPSVVYVYSGCNPACTLLSTTTLNGLSMFGHVGRQNKRFVTGDLTFGDIEIYSYKSSGLSLLYSFDGGLGCAINDCEGAAYSPGSMK